MRRKNNTAQSLQSEATKERITDTAAEMLKTEEYASITVRRICERSGVSTGAFYYHFSGIDELFAYLYNKEYEKYKKAAAEKLAEADCIEKIYMLFAHSADSCKGNGVDITAHFYSGDNKLLKMKVSSRDTSPLSNTFGLDMRNYIQQAFDEGRISKKIDVYTLERNLFIVYYGTILDWTLSDGGYDLTEKTLEMIREYISFYMI